MADINSPKEFLTELLGITDQLEADRTALIECGERKKSLENAFASMKNSIEKEKNKTISDRRYDIETGFDKQLKAVNAELKSAGDKRQKALNEGMKAKTKEATKGVKQEADAFKNALKAYAGTNKLPAILKSRLYYRIFCPSIFGYLVYLAILLLIMYISGSMTKAKALAGESTTVYFAIGLVAIVLLFAYIMIWSNTRVRYRDEIKNCLNIINSIKANEKKARNIEKTIKKAGDDSSYDLHEFDTELAGLNQKKAEIEAQKAGALNEFETVTKDRLMADIDENYKDRLAEKTAEINDAAAEHKAVSDRITAAESRINKEFVSYIGAKNLDRNKINMMLEMLENGTAASVSEAASKLDEQ